MIVALIGLLTLAFMIIIASKRQHENEDALMAIKLQELEFKRQNKVLTSCQSVSSGSQFYQLVSSGDHNHL